MEENTTILNKKELRSHILCQLEVLYPHFGKLKRAEKREIVKKVSKTVMRAINQGQMDVRELSIEEQLGLGPLPKGIMSLDQMARFIEDHERVLFSLPQAWRKQHIKDPLLQFIDQLLDDSLLDRLLAPSGMTPSMRTWMPSRLLRIELLRTVRFPEWSVRKFCDYIESLARKEERAFCHLPLNRKEMCDHSLLSTFRTGLDLERRVNLLVYVLHHFFASGRLGTNVIHLLDSTDVAERINSRPLFKLEFPDGTFVRFYGDLHADCGKRRQKRDKSEMFVGYRVHTLCVADVQSGMAFPLLSVAVAANHHDSQLLEPLLSLAQAIGLELKVLGADEAYADAAKQAKLRQEHDILLVTPPKAKAEVQPNVEQQSGAVFCHGGCEQPMRWLGFDNEDGGHVFCCDAENGACSMASSCPKERIIPIDTGLFGPIPRCIGEAQEVIELRKVTERPFNLLKHMDGMEPCRMKTHKTIAAQLVFSQITGLFKVMAQLRAVVPIKGKLLNKQEVLPIAM
jgi:hypothetical protein